MDLSHAIEKHAEWKVKFRSAITDHQTMDAEKISKDNCCELGKWLHGEAKLTLSKLPSYSDCVAKHASFHIEAGKVAEAINAKNFAVAEAMLNGDTQYAAASKAIGVAIMKLRKESAL